MEPLNVQVKVTVEFGPKAAELLEGLLKGSPTPVARPVPAPVPVKHEDPIDIGADEDMPDFTGESTAAAPAPSKEISDADLRPVVKAAKDRAGAKAVRDVFTSFGIASSVECPQERRSDLVAKLNELN